MPRQMRRNPSGAWSTGWAAIKWAQRHDPYSTIALLYGNEDSLRADHARSAAWRRVSGLRAMSPSGHLTKTPCGVPYLDFGWRCFPAGKDSRGVPFGPHESPTDRIRVPIVAGGSNRRAAIRHLHQSEELWVFFCLLQATDADHLRQAAKCLAQNTLTSGIGLPPVKLPGLCVFDRFVRIAKEVAY